MPTNTETVHPLVAIREEKALSQGDLAKKAEVDRSTVARWESGEVIPRPHHRRRLARALGIPVSRVGQMFGLGMAA